LEDISQKPFAHFLEYLLASSLLFLVPWLEENLAAQTLVFCQSICPEEVLLSWFSSTHRSQGMQGAVMGGKDAEGTSSLHRKEGSSAEKAFSFRAHGMRKHRWRLSEKK